MTDYHKALAALRKERDENASVGHAPISWFLVDQAIAALDAAQGRREYIVAEVQNQIPAIDHYTASRIVAMTIAMSAAPPAAAVPAGWREHVEDRIRTWRQSFVNRHGDQLEILDFMGSDSLDDLIDYVCSGQVQPAAAAVPADNVTPMRQPRADLARLVESINAAVYANGDGLSVTEAIGALELAKLELLKEQEQ